MELAQLCQAEKIPLHIALIPELHTLAGNYEFKDVHDLMRGVGKTVKADVLDLIDGFPASGEPKDYWVCPGDSHPNGKANELIAARLDAALRAERWIK